MKENEKSNVARTEKNIERYKKYLNIDKSKKDDHALL